MRQLLSSAEEVCFMLSIVHILHDQLLVVE